MKAPNTSTPKLDEVKTAIIVEKLPDYVVPERYGSSSFFEDYLETRREFTRLVKKVELLVRKSPEMKYYIQYLKDELDLNKCYFYKNVSLDDVSIELHHYPFTLFDISEIVCKKAIMDPANRGFFSTFKLAEEVVSLHYQNIVGLVPLSVTLHQLAHDGEIFIPVSAVFGDVKEFIRQYRDFIDPTLIEKLENLLMTSPSEIHRLNYKLSEHVEYKYRKDHELVQKQIFALLEDKTNQENNSKTNEE